MLDFHASRTFYIWRRKRDLNPQGNCEIAVNAMFSIRGNSLLVPAWELDIFTRV